MRIVTGIPHDRYKVTIFRTGSRLVVQIEDGRLIQLYRFDESDTPVNLLVDEVVPNLLAKTDPIFKQMRSNMHVANLSQGEPPPTFDEIL